uniref:C2H2-type domain-containing protein n=1 Tax=Parastrongyloides trichosuri TaxID=131310 RepID=A0A0N4Z8P2_PARTI
MPKMEFDANIPKYKQVYIPTVEDLRETYNTCLSNELRNKFQISTHDWIADSFTNMYDEARNYFLSLQYINTQIEISKIVRLGKEMYPYMFGIIKERCLEIIEKALEMIKDLNFISMKFYRIDIPIESVIEKYNENLLNMKGNISVEDFHEMIKGNTNILVINYENDKEKQIDLKNESNVSIVQLNPTILNNCSRYSDFFVKLSVDERNTIEKTNYSDIVLVGGTHDKDYSYEVNQKIINILKQLKNIQFNSFYPDARYTSLSCIEQDNKSSDVENNPKTTKNGSNSNKEGDKKAFECHVCFLSYTSRQALSRHINVHTMKNLYTCEYCKKVYLRHDNLKKHLKVHLKCKQTGKEWDKSQRTTESSDDNNFNSREGTEEI